MLYGRHQHDPSSVVLLEQGQRLGSGSHQTPAELVLSLVGLLERFIHHAGRTPSGSASARASPTNCGPRRKCRMGARSDGLRSRNAGEADDVGRVGPRAGVRLHLGMVGLFVQEVGRKICRRLPHEFGHMSVGHPMGKQGSATAPSMPARGSSCRSGETHDVEAAGLKKVARKQALVGVHGAGDAMEPSGAPSRSGARLSVLASSRRRT